MHLHILWLTSQVGLICPSQAPRDLHLYRKCDLNYDPNLNIYSYFVINEDNNI